MLFILAIDPLQRILDLATQHGILTPLPLTAAKLRTSLYADAAAIFVNPTRDQLQSVKQILHAFGAATGLTINFEKSSVHPIRCENVDLRDKGQLLNRAGRLTLITSVLSFMPTYHLTIFPLSKWARNQIDKVRRSYLWKGKDNANGGHCLDNWPTVSRPKDLGGLGVLDLEKFGRALKLRWLWQEWTYDSKPWGGLQVPRNTYDRLLFQASTYVTVGNGAKAKFWRDAWLDGEAPYNLAPHLFALVKRKNRSMLQELTNTTWIKPLRRKIIMTVQIEEFVSLWIRLQQVHLQPGVEDTITWRWTSDGIYSSKSAYRAQFIGFYCGYKPGLIWRAKAENKRKRGWPHQMSCTMCNGPMESGLHLCLTCPFAQEVWNLILAWENMSLPQQAAPTNATGLGEWWKRTETFFPKTHRRDFNSIVIYTWWNIWKEWNRRVFLALLVLSAPGSGAYQGKSFSL
ncbi:hypothetical protein BS78_03G355400 [Paspalum vaginatum]|nr:hypothetical protein BS78_03G355400 [Paspalum vaginatum]